MNYTYTTAGFLVKVETYTNNWQPQARMMDQIFPLNELRTKKESASSVGSLPLYAWVLALLPITYGDSTGTHNVNWSYV